MFTLFMILAFEGTTAFSRQKNMTMLRGMSNKGFGMKAYRNGAWVNVESSALLPGDVISLRRVPGAEPTIVPADCVLLRGTAVVNESNLTGESVPQVTPTLTLNLTGESVPQVTPALTLTLTLTLTGESVPQVTPTLALALTLTRTLTGESVPHVTPTLALTLALTLAPT